MCEKYMTETNNKVPETIKEISKELHPNGEKSFDNEMHSIVGDQKRIRKKCQGCCDTFTCYKSKNYDYCSSCEINGNRYLNKDSPCSECDGSGLVKFKGQPPRNCKLCYLAQQEKRGDNIFAKR